MNDMSALKIKLASLWDELFCRAPESKRLVKQVISPSNEFIAEKRKKNKEFDGFDHEHGTTFHQHKTHRHIGVWPYESKTNNIPWRWLKFHN
jgi:hypothetical protein